MIEIFKLIGTIAINSQEANEEIDNTVDNAEDAQGKLNSAFKKVGTAVAGAFAVDKIKDFGVACVNTADGITSAMGSFSASTGVSGQALEEYENVLKNIYKANYGESFEDIAAAMAEVKQQAGDIGADALESMTTDAIILRDTFDFEVNESMRAAQMLMDQFGLSSKQAFNMIAQGAQNGLNKNGDLLDSINEYSVHYKQLGLTADEFFNSLANGTKAGTFSVDKLGDAMKEFGIRVKDGSDSTAEAFEYLGYDADKLFKTFNKGGKEAADMTQILIDELASMPDGVEKTTAGVALFGTMWEDLGEKGIEALSNLEGNISSTTDALTGINEVKYDTLGDALEGLRRTFETSVLVPLGEKLIPLVEDIIAEIPVIVEKIENVCDWVNNNRTTIEMWTSAILGAVAAIGTFLLILNWGSIMSAAAKTISGVRTAVIAFNTALLANPIALVVAAIAGLVASFIYLWNNVDGFKEFWIDSWNKMGDMLDKTFENAEESIKNSVKKIKSFLDFEWKFPDIPLPHFSISGSSNPLDWIEKGVPKLAVEWYAKGALLKGPTAFGINGDTGSLMVGGEAETEVIAPVSELNGMIRNAVNNQEVVFYLQQLIDKVNNLIDAVGGGDVVLYNYMGTDLLEEKIIKAQQSITLRSGGRA